MKLLLIASFSYKEVVLVGIVKSLVRCRHYFKEGCIQSNNTCNEISLDIYMILRNSQINF
jgi:hypothetical protein